MNPFGMMSTLTLSSKFMNGHGPPESNLTAFLIEEGLEREFPHFSNFVPISLIDSD